jgi:hypothetical protein
VLGDPNSAERAIQRKWWGTGIKGLLKSLAERKQGNDFEREYDWIYAQLSDYTHSGSRILPAFVQQISETSIRMLYRPQRSQDPTLPWSITEWLCQIAGLTGAAFDLGLDDMVGLAQQMAKSLLSSQPE